MNILYVSNMFVKKDIGPYWSIPNQVHAQSKLDNVMWYNLQAVEDGYWKEKANYKSLLDFPSGIISDLPSPFNKPDIIVCEEFYVYKYQFIKQLKKLNIPYVIISRGSMTMNAQHKHYWKKVLGNMLMFNSFSKRAAAIQYLTEDEKLNSGHKWNCTSCVIPNGIDFSSLKQGIVHNYDNIDNVIKGIFIGRISIYHKGLDLLVDACKQIETLLRKRHVQIEIYGPDREHEKDKLRNLIERKKISDILLVQDSPIFGEEKESKLLASDFFLLTSRLEGHPMGLIEALSYGLPSVVTRGSNMLKEIKEADAGWVAEIDAISIAQALKKMVIENDKFVIKSNNAISLARKYQWDLLAKNAHYFYQSLLNHK